MKFYTAREIYNHLHRTISKQDYDAHIDDLDEYDTRLDEEVDQHKKHLKRIINKLFIDFLDTLDDEELTILQECSDFDVTEDFYELLQDYHPSHND